MRPERGHKQAEGFQNNATDADTALVEDNAQN